MEKSGDLAVLSSFYYWRYLTLPLWRSVSFVHDKRMSCSMKTSIMGQFMNEYFINAANIGHSIKALRQRAAMSQERLAKALRL